MIDWKRIEVALFQHMQKDMTRANQLSVVMQQLRALTTYCGEKTNTRKALTKVGKLLLCESKPPSIIAPCCPDYTHKYDRYTFCGLHGEVSLLAQKHIVFLKALLEIIPNMEVILLYANHESDDPRLLQITKLSKATFDSLVEDSIRVTQKQVASLGWKVDAMTRVATNLITLETEWKHLIATNPNFQARITNETSDRKDMYYKICPTMTHSEMLARTVTTAAQYAALGTFAAAEGHLICNHSTTSLSWYQQTEAAVLHNPVIIY